jgi:hypothetical protein
MKPIVLALILAVGAGAPSHPFISTPKLSLQCGIPDQQEIVACRLSGRGFYPGERLQISYLVTFTAMPRRHGQFPQAHYRRLATSNRTGTFMRPPLSFVIVRFHESFRLRVTVVGSRGDRATMTTIAIAQ